VDLLKNLGLDILGVFTPVASIMSLIKTTVQIIRKKKCTRNDVVTILIGILGLVPIAS
jgi:hypothetical protein